MADILLNKVVNEEINLNSFIKWLLVTDPQEQYFTELNDYKCSQIDFLTHFLNFVHEEIPCRKKYGDTPQKVSAVKRIEPLEGEEVPLKEQLTASQDNMHKISNPFSLNKNVEISNLSLNDDSQCSSLNYSHITSTPKGYKTHSDCNITNGYLSPISPLYKIHNSFTTPRTRRPGNTSQKSIEKAPSLCLGDFIVHKKPSVKKKASRSLHIEENGDEASKRIKPTCLNKVKVNGDFRRTENSFNNFQNTKELSVGSVNESRNFLAEERLKILSRKNSGDNLTLISTKKIGSFVSNKIEVEPDIACVTNKKYLEHLVNIYVVMLKNNLVLNVGSEIYFLISLLVSKQLGFKESRACFSDNSSEDLHAGVDFLNEEDRSEVLNVVKRENVKVNVADLFEPIHNIVYFAVKCLESQLEILKCYDRSTLKLLSSNHRLKAFSCRFTEKLSKLADKKPDRIVELCDDNHQTNVCFNLDTDNRGNFPNDSSFHTFRKQRDLFYEVLRIWENNRLLPGWSFSVSLGGKIRGMFGLQNEPANFMHFSRLFKAQLLSTCGKLQREEDLSESQMPFLSSLPNLDAEKLNRLKSRLVTKQSSNGINPLPTFSGLQEFYRDFIITAGNYAFNKHLCDTFIAEIMELSDSSFSCSDLEEPGSEVDPGTRKAYVACLKSLRILAKFLGFVESLPYKSETYNCTENFLATQINIRQQTTPSFNIKELLLNSVKVNNTILTIPWITEYLAMLDYVTLRLPYYLSVHKILFHLYKHSNSLHNYNNFTIKFCLGWLFELPHFPDSEYFGFCTNLSPELNLYKKQIQAVKSKTKCLDDLNVIDQNILYICCPYLEEIKKLLSSNNVNSNVTVRHITPVTALQSSNEMVKKRLELQLEEAFFNGQPVSVRKTVEFVSERVASTCVKHMCNVVIPTFRKNALEEVRSYLNSWKEANSVLSPVKDKAQKSSLKTKLNQMAQDDFRSLKENCEREVAGIAKEKIPFAIDSLLAVDVLPQTKDVCHAITTKICLDRVTQWINSHITLSMFTKDLDGELQRIFSLENKATKEKRTFMIPPGGNGKKHNEDTLSVFHLIEKIKITSVDILRNPTDVSDNIIFNILEESYGTINKRCDVNDCAISNTCSLLVDFALLLISHKPHLMKRMEILEKFVTVWRCLGSKTTDLFKNFLCPRNTMLLAQSLNATLTWEVFAEFIAHLIKENLLSCEDFEAQCAGFFKKEWDQVSLRNFSAFLYRFVECFKSYGRLNGKFTYLLDFLSDFCSDL